MLDFRNRFIFPPIKLGFSDGSGTVNQRHVDFYHRRSAHVGAITLEPLYMDAGLRELPTQLGIDRSDKVDGLRTLTEVIHGRGAQVIAHLNHPGRMANPAIPKNFFVSSTDKACENGGAEPRPMKRQDMQQATDLFARSATRAQESGFDAIELQFGHGYLLAQFISPAVNDRRDEYGGSLENRLRFPLEVLEAVQCATSLPIIVRLSGDEMTSHGIKVDEMIVLSQILERHGVAALHVSAGTVCSTPPWFFQHMFVPKGKTWELGATIKSAVHLPVIFVGRVDSKEDIDTLRSDYRADYIAIGRGLVADPDLVGKYLGEIPEAIRPCLACAEGCLGGVRGGKGLQCLVNPQVGESEAQLAKATVAKRYLVVGGGLAGMEAALVLRERGHSADLYEKAKLGGQFNLAHLTPNKATMASLVPYLKQRIHETNVRVVHAEATSAVAESGYDGVILATGSVPSVPNIEGLTTYSWAEILLPQNLPTGKHVLIIGGGLIGVDVATALIPRGNRVTIVKRTTDFGEDMEAIAKSLSLKMMRDHQVFMSDHTQIVRIDGRHVFAVRNGAEMDFDDVDIIVISTGMESYRPLVEQLADKVPTYPVGDARLVGNAQDAIRDAYETASQL